MAKLIGGVWTVETVEDITKCGEETRFYLSSDGHFVIAFGGLFANDDKHFPQKAVVLGHNETLQLLNFCNFINAKEWAEAR